jgi:hypothetical protein
MNADEIAVWNRAALQSGGPSHRGGRPRAQRPPPRPCQTAPLMRRPLRKGLRLLRWTERSLRLVCLRGDARVLLR